MTILEILAAVVLVVVLAIVFVSLAAFVHELMCQDCIYNKECEKHKDDQNWVPPCRNCQNYQINHGLDGNMM